MVTRNHRNQPKRTRAAYMREYRARHKILPEVPTASSNDRADDRVWKALLESRLHMDDLRELLLCTRADVNGFTAAIAKLVRQCNNLDRRYEAIKERIDKTGASPGH